MTGSYQSLEKNAGMESFGILISVTLVTYVACSTIARYKDPLTLCDENVVCSKINALTYFTEQRHYFSYVTCQCPGDQKCPEEPGKQTILVEDGLWYGLCSPIDEMRPCMSGEIAETLNVDMERKTNIKINCICPAHELEVLNPGDSATEWLRSSAQNGFTIHQLVCGGGSAPGMDKRRGRGRGGFRKFYFYRK